MKLELTPEQLAVAQSVMAAINRGAKQITIGGLAGTGKTVVAQYLASAIRGSRVVTPTGKAAYVLRQKGIMAETIHSVIYQVVGVKQARDAGGRVTEKAEPIFDMKDDAYLERPSVFIVDEASMVNYRLYQDMLRQGVPIIWIGDHGQLPPVGEDPGIMRQPDYVLQKIHRQAEDNPIIQLAYAVRVGEPVDKFRGTNSDRVSIYGSMNKKRLVEYALSNNVDQIVCAFNRTRHAINAAYRNALGYSGLLCENERVICLHNNKAAGIFNGMSFTVGQIVEDTASTVVADLLVDDCNRRWPSTEIDAGAFGKNIYDMEAMTGEVFDYAYAITANKSQGSEWPHVLVVDETCKKWDMNRWRYTAFTRAKERLTVVKGCWA